MCRNGRGTRLRGSVYGQTVSLVSLFKRVFVAANSPYKRSDKKSLLLKY